MAVMRHSIIFGGVDSADYGIYISGEGVFNAPEREVEMVAIPGRNGALVLDHGRYENISVTYPAFNYEPDYETFAHNLSEFRNAICSQTSYQRLEDTFHPDEYRMAAYTNGLEVEPIKYNTASQFEIRFNCKPQRFLTEGELPIELVTDYEKLLTEDSDVITDENSNDIEAATAEITKITNPTEFDSLPLIIITGPGVVSIGDQIITVTDIPATKEIYIDSEAMEIYTSSGGIVSPASSHVSFNKNSFPKIAPGQQGFSHTAPVQIIPRWWRI